MQKLTQFIKEGHPRIELASEQDNEEVLEFYHKTFMQNKENSLRYERSPNFFAYQNLIGYRSYTFVYRESDVIKAMGTLALQKATNQQGSICIGYLCDLRSFGSSMKGRVYWRSFYKKLIDHYKEIEELKDCDYFNTVIMANNSKAKQNLSRSHNLGLEYKKITSLHMNILSNKLVIKPMGLKSNVREITPQELEHYYKQLPDDLVQSSYEQYYEQFNRIQEADPKAQLVGVFHKEQIQAITYIWTDHHCKRIIYHEDNKLIRLLSFLLRPLDILPKNHSSLKMIHLTPLQGVRSFEKSIVAYAIKRANQTGMQLLSLPFHMKYRPFGLLFTKNIDLYEVIGQNKSRLTPPLYFDFSRS